MNEEPLSPEVMAYMVILLYIVTYIKERSKKRPHRDIWLCFTDMFKLEYELPIRLVERFNKNYYDVTFEIGMVLQQCMEKYKEFIEVYSRESPQRRSSVRSPQRLVQRSFQRSLLKGQLMRSRIY